MRKPNSIRTICEKLALNETPIDEAYVRFVFSLDADDKANVLSSLSSRIFGDVKKKPIIRIGRRNLTIAEFVNTRSETLYEVDLLKDTREKSYFALPSNAKIIGPWKWLSTTPAGQKSDEAMRIIDSERRDAPGDPKEFSPEDLNHLVATAFHRLLDEQMPTVIFWEYDEDQLLPGKISTSQFSNDPDTCLPLKHMFQLAGYDDPSAAITAALERSNGMRNLLRRISRISTRHLHRVWKEYGDLELELVENGDRINAHVLDRYNTYDLSRRSDGFKRFIAFLLHISVKAQTDDLTNALYLDDEPDIGLHPSGARYLRDELVKVSRENHVVYATHSIFMIDGENLHRHLIVSKKNEVTSVEEANESNFSKEEVIFKALGYSLFEHLSAVNILFEGWRDKRLFEVALAGSHPKCRKLRNAFATIGRCYAHGAKDVGRITAMLELARRACVIVSDNDQPAREQQRAYRGYGKWLRYDQVLGGDKVVTGEDFVTDAAFGSMLERIRRKEERLASSPLPDLSNNRGKLHSISGWLSRAGFRSDEIKEILKQIKDTVFAKLTPTHIAPHYFDFLAALSQHLPKRERGGMKGGR